MITLGMHQETDVNAGRAADEAYEVWTTECMSSGSTNEYISLCVYLMWNRWTPNEMLQKHDSKSLLGCW